MLNDFIFCPYSIYLHNVYMDTDESMYNAIPQTRGKLCHESVDTKKGSNRKDEIFSLPVSSDRFHLFGKIDVYRQQEKKLIERKFQMKKIFRGQIYQLWAQYFCMVEMGYEVDKLAFYEISTNKMIDVVLPTESDEKEFSDFITNMINYDPSCELITNDNKCSHCIYNSLCDKTNITNVY